MISEHVPSLMLTYCPKRIGYINDRFAARHVLAFLDHNHHLNRGQLLRKMAHLFSSVNMGKEQNSGMPLLFRLKINTLTYQVLLMLLDKKHYLH